MTARPPMVQDETVQLLLARVQSLAEAWAVDPHGSSAKRLLGPLQAEAGPVDESRAVDLVLGAVLVHAQTLGAVALPSGAPAVAEPLVELFKSEAALALAKRYLADTGTDPQEASRQVSTIAGAAAAGRPVPDDCAPVEAWLVAHWGGAAERHRFGEFVGSNWRAAFLSLALDAAEGREAEAKTRRVPTLRRGTHFLRTLLTTEEQVTKAIRKAGGSIAPEEREARRLFKYQPLGAAERLVMHALASHARDQGLLDAHPWATASHAMPKNGDAPRVRIPYPGTSELARILGYGAGPDGKISRARRATIEHAIRDLTTKPRWIAMRVLLPPVKKGGPWMEDTEVQQELWIRAAVTIMSRGVYLDLHPAAIASHLKSFEDVPDLAARYDAARDALGAREIRDEWAVADDYARWLALSITAKGRRDGMVPATAGTAAGDLAIERKLTFDTLVSTLGLGAFAKKQGRPATAERIRLALRFCEQMGSVRGVAEDDGMWVLRLPMPDARGADADQLLALAPGSLD